MNSAPMISHPAALLKRARRTPQQQLAAAELQALRVRLAGKWLLARSDADVHAFGVLAELKRSPEALEAFAD